MWSNWSALQGLNAFIWSGGIAGPGAGADWLPALEAPTAAMRRGPGLLGNGDEILGTWTVLTQGRGPYAASPLAVCGDHIWGAPTGAGVGTNWYAGPGAVDRNGMPAGQHYYHFSLYAQTEAADVLCNPYVYCGFVAPISYSALINPVDFGRWHKLFDHQIVLDAGDTRFHVDLATVFIGGINKYCWWDKIVLRALDQCAPTAMEAGIMDPASVCIEGDMWGAQR